MKLPTRRVIAIALNFALAVSLLGTSLPATANDSTAVYAAFFKYLDQPKRTYFIRQTPAQLRDLPLRSEEKSLQAFQFNPTPSAHSTKTFGATSVYLLTEQEYVEIFSGTRKCGDNWNLFHQRFPKAKALMQISQVNFSANGERAVLLLHTHAACLGGSWDFLFFQRKNSTWVFKQSINSGRS